MPRDDLDADRLVRMQVSEVAHALVSACGESGMVWERRGEVEVKGKGAMVTYFLAEDVLLRNRSDQ